MASLHTPEPPVDLPGGALAAIDDRVILDALGDAIVAADDGNRIVYCNGAAERLLGWPSGELYGRLLLDIIPPRMHEAHLGGFSRYVHTGVPTLIGRAVRVPALHRDGHEVDVELTLSAFKTQEDRRVFVASLRDLTERVQLERQQAMTSYFRATSEVALLLGLDSTVTTLEAAASLVLHAMGTSLGWQFGALWLVGDDGESLRCEEVWCADDVHGEEFARLTKQTRLRRGVGLPGIAWEQAAPAWVEDLARAGSRFPRAQAAAELGFHGGFAFPVVAEGRCLGAIEFFHHEVKPVDPDLQGVVATIGAHLGQFLERRRAEAELRSSHRRFASLARTLQASLLPPHLPDIPGLEVAARYRPAGKAAEVGGDFYDVFPIRGTSWGFVMGDVCGKGAEAATATALARYTLRAAVMRARRPRNVLAVLNEAMNRQDDSNRFITVSFATVRPDDDGAGVVLSLGGHPPAVLRRADGRAALVGRPGTVLGIVDEPVLFDQALRLGPGDTLVFYTDGVTEARRGGEQFGDQRLLAAVEGAPGRTAADVADALEAAVNEFQPGDARDDLAILVVHVPSGGSGI